ncbi:unnamed protein product [Paramecium sonneborni]|uniref:Uncharacterized protein n=1 Tax=Paramecium sonneborni TaxID=65129 RepID=A0A8S1MKG0_9CILI|nr:unnamed protein product [Paramecium sonneborni]
MNSLITKFIYEQNVKKQQEPANQIEFTPNFRLNSTLSKKQELNQTKQTQKLPNQKKEEFCVTYALIKYLGQNLKNKNYLKLQQAKYYKEMREYFQFKLKKEFYKLKLKKFSLQSSSHLDSQCIDYIAQYQASILVKRGKSTMCAPQKATSWRV